ncbi:ABC transporter permease [Pelagibacterium lentulum]|uniref:Peptide ABC transporter permease n=1 Tax=Pelagibacterium lentulum TaxID=2029865 RepID=A0A916VZK1_9HYPH|nr:ABC transporter permease [Pelagibacterium lentulum]GGA55180.1 peptide ABC transporter permease [Pelagibacterium lentulum]
MSLGLKPEHADAVPSVGPVPPASPKGRELRKEFKRAWRSMVVAKWPVVALFILLCVVIAAVFGPLLAPFDPNRQNIMIRLLDPLQQSGNAFYLLGTDALGRDVFSRLLYGARISLLVGLCAIAVGGTIGVIAGLVSGYFGGWIDDVIMRLGDIQLAFPFILLAIMFLVVLGPGVLNIILVLGIGQWVTYARIVRAQTLSLREKEFVEAARALGDSTPSIIFRTILPNIVAPLTVIASFNVASVILSEAALSFLGLGVPPSVPTWGSMLAESRDQLIANRWWLAFFPGIAIVLTVLSFNIIGDWLRDFLDPRLKTIG